MTPLLLASYQSFGGALVCTFDFNVAFDETVFEDFTISNNLGRGITTFRGGPASHCGYGSANRQWGLSWDSPEGEEKNKTKGIARSLGYTRKFTCQGKLTAMRLTSKSRRKPRGRQ